MGEAGLGYDIFPVRDGKYGREDADTGAWTGMIGEVMRKVRAWKGWRGGRKVRAWGGVERWRRVCVDSPGREGEGGGREGGRERREGEEGGRERREGGREGWREGPKVCVCGGEEWRLVQEAGQV